MRLLTAFLAFSLLFAFSCDDDDSYSDQTPPALPPSEVLDPDLDTFSGASKTNAEATGQNFRRASATALLVNGFIAGNLAIPSGFIAAAQGASEPQLRDGNTWVWEFSNSAMGSSFSSELSAEVFEAQDSIAWELRIDANSGMVNIEDLLILDGATNQEVTEGNWNTYLLTTTENSGVATAETEWQFVDSTDYRANTEIVVPNIALTGDAFSFDKLRPEKETRYIDASEQDTTFVFWNYLDGGGYIQAPDYNNGDRACWNAAKEDADCATVGY